MMNRYIFLDVDGVCNSELWYVTQRRDLHNYKCGDFDPEVIARLNTLKDDGVQIIISSSWGSDAIKPLNKLGLELPIIGVTDHFYADHIVRGNEIKKWLNEHTNYPYDDYEYVILDDDTDMLLEQADNFIHVDNSLGLTDDDVEKIKKILKIEK